MSSKAAETTLYSLSEAAPQPCERREGERHMTLYRVGSLWVDDRRELCLIKNISGGGMMVRVYSPIAVGSRVSVELKTGQPIAGTVSWARDPNIGVTFDTSIDVIDVLSSSMEGPRPRLPRIEVSSFVTLRDGASTFRMRTADISQGGLKLTCETMLAPGTEVVVTLKNLAPIHAVVRWSEEGQMGLTFNRVLTLPVLVGWLQGSRDRLRAAG